MNTISTRLEQANKDVAEKALALLNKTAEFIQDADVRSCFALASNHGMRLDKIPDVGPTLQALSTALTAHQTALKDEDKERADEIKASADPVVVDAVPVREDTKK